jgi:hypothetical protein
MIIGPNLKTKLKLKICMQRELPRTNKMIVIGKRQGWNSQPTEMGGLPNQPRRLH